MLTINNHQKNTNYSTSLVSIMRIRRVHFPLREISVPHNHQPSCRQTHLALGGPIQKGCWHSIMTSSCLAVLRMGKTMEQSEGINICSSDFWQISKKWVWSSKLHMPCLTLTYRKIKIIKQQWRDTMETTPSRLRLIVAWFLITPELWEKWGACASCI